MGADERRQNRPQSPEVTSAPDCELRVGGRWRAWKPCSPDGTMILSRWRPRPRISDEDSKGRRPPSDAHSRARPAAFSPRAQNRALAEVWRRSQFSTGPCATVKLSQESFSDSSPTRSEAASRSYRRPFMYRRIRASFSALLTTSTAQIAAIGQPTIVSISSKHKSAVSGWPATSMPSGGTRIANRYFKTVSQPRV